MTRPNSTSHDCANNPRAKAGHNSSRNGSTNSVIVNKIREIYPRDTIKTLASWLRLSLKTAKNRMLCNREFSLDEVAALLHSEHGFEILSALMTKAPRVPRWWRLCVPLMDLADAERMVHVIRKRTAAAIANREEVTDALETEIRRAQTLAIHGQEQAGVHARALRTLTLAGNRVVARRGR